MTRRVLWAGVCALAALASEAGAEPVACHASDRYLVIERERGGRVGTDLLVRGRTGPAEPACAYAPGEGDFLPAGEEEPYRFMALRHGFLILERGTGPASDLVVFDLDTRQKILDVRYSGDGMAMTDEEIVFWMRTGEGTPSNCSRYGEFEKDGLGAAIETQVTFDLVSARLRKSARTRCTATQ